MSSDPIADMLTSIRNANLARKETVDIPFSKVKNSIASILLENGFIKKFDNIEVDNKKFIKITLKYFSKNKPVITNLKRISRPGLRRYVRTDEIFSVYGGRGISIISTSKGIMTGIEARKNKIGGEILCNVW